MGVENCKHAEEGRRAMEFVIRALEEGALSKPTALAQRQMQFAEGQLWEG